MSLAIPAKLNCNLADRTESVGYATQKPEALVERIILKPPPAKATSLPTFSAAPAPPPPLQRNSGESG